MVLVVNQENQEIIMVLVVNHEKSPLDPPLGSVINQENHENILVLVVNQENQEIIMVLVVVGLTKRGGQWTLLVVYINQSLIYKSA